MKLPFQLVGFMSLIIFSVGIYGLIESRSQIRWPTYGSYIFIGLITLFILSLVYKIKPKIGIIFFCLIIFTMVFGSLTPTIVVFLYFISAACVGNIIINKIFKQKNFDIILSFIIGSAFYVLLLTITSHFNINNRYSVGIIFLATFIASKEYLLHIINGVKCAQINFQSDYRYYYFVLSTILVIYYILSLMPEIGHDALAFHLYLPNFISKNHFWNYDVSVLIGSVMPMGGTLLYSLVFMLGGEPSVRLLNLLFIIITCQLIKELVAMGGGSKKGYLTAIILYVSTPLIFLETSTAFIESIWSVFLIGSLVFAIKINSDGNTYLKFSIASFIFGIALVCKAISFLFFPIISFIILYKIYILKDNIKFAKVIALLFIAILLPTSITYGFAYFTTGNPLFPFFNGFFKSNLWFIDNFKGPSIFDKGITFRTIYDITFHSYRFLESSPGAAGVVGIILFPLSLFSLIYKRNKIVILLVFSSLIFTVLVFQGTAYLRYVVPSFILMFSIIGIQYEKVNELLSPYFAKFIVLICFVFNIIFLHSGSYYGKIDLKLLLGYKTIISYFNENLPIRNAVIYLNYININNSNVAFFSSPLIADINAKPIINNWYNFNFSNSINSVDSNDKFLELLINNKVEYLILDKSILTNQLITYISNSADLIQKFGENIEVRKLKSDYYFSKELLNSPGFSNLSLWNLSDSNSKIDGGIIVSLSKPGSQRIQVDSNSVYLISLKSKCFNDKSAKGRVQINWLDAEDKLIKPDIDVFLCDENYSSHELNVAAPQNAVSANVYATSHSETPIVIKSVSLKKKLF